MKKLHFWPFCKAKTSEEYKSPIPKKVRHEIYVRALKQYKELCKTNKQFGLCCSIDQAAIDLDYMGNTFNPYHFMQNYPEIFKYKPAILSVTGYWWPIDNTAVRVQILREAIEATK